MTMTYKAITGRITIPGTDLGIRAKVTATPMSTDHVLAFDDRATWGPRTVETDTDGNLPTGTSALRIPQGSTLGDSVLWKITAEPIDKSGVSRWIVATTTVTADTTIQALAHPDVTVVTPALATTVGENAAAAATSAADAAASATSAHGWADAASSSAADAATDADLAAASATEAADNANGFSAGTATALAPGATPTVSITGTAPSRVINLGIPAGTADDASMTATYNAGGTFKTALSDSIAAKADPNLLALTFASPPVVFAHRGGGQLGSGGLGPYPENSMEAFRVAAAGGFPLEMDLRPLSDGTTIVVSHDATVTRTMTGISGNVNANTISQWRAARVKPAWPNGRPGTPATWQQVLDEFGGRILLVPEMKDTMTDAQIDAVLDSIQARNLSKSVLVQAGGLGSASTKCLARGIPFVIVPSDTSNNPATLKAMGINYIAPGGAAANSTYVGQCVAAGLKVVPYTFDRRTDLATVLGWGASGMISNDPAGVTERYMPKVVESFDSGYGWPESDGYNLADTLQYLEPASPGFVLGDGNNGAFYRRLGQFHRGNMVGRFQFDIKFKTYGLSQTRFASIFIGHKVSDLAFADGLKADDTDAGTQGYHILIRRSATCDIFTVNGATKTSLVSGALGTTDTFGPVGSEGPTLTFEVVIDSTNVTLKCLTNGTQITVANTAHRYTDAFVNIGNNGAHVLFKQIRVQR